MRVWHGSTTCRALPTTPRGSAAVSQRGSVGADVRYVRPEVLVEQPSGVPWTRWVSPLSERELRVSTLVRVRVYVKTLI